VIKKAVFAAIGLALLGCAAAVGFDQGCRFSAEIGAQQHLRQVAVEIDVYLRVLSRANEDGCSAAISMLEGKLDEGFEVLASPDLTHMVENDELVKRVLTRVREYRHSQGASASEAALLD